MNWKCNRWKTGIKLHWRSSLFAVVRNLIKAHTCSPKPIHCSVIVVEERWVSESTISSPLTKTAPPCVHCVEAPGEVCTQTRGRKLLVQVTIVKSVYFTPLCCFTDDCQTFAVPSIKLLLNSPITVSSSCSASLTFGSSCSTSWRSVLADR